ncbi:hypothetical protein JEZ13_02830 [bacterium]|nr:hypothetical protein [bacterium]
MNSPLLSLFLLTLFFILNILDAHSTWLVIRPNHYYRERNILARYCFKKLGLIKGILFFKLFLLSVFSIIIIMYVWPEYLTLNISILIGDLIFTLVVFNNYRIHRKLKRKYPF